MDEDQSGKWNSRECDLESVLVSLGEIRFAKIAEDGDIPKRYAEMR